MDALKAWFAKEWNKDVYTVGPLLASKPTKYGVSSNNGSLSSEIEVFLDKSLKQYGEKSLVLVSPFNVMNEACWLVIDAA